MSASPVKGCPSPSLMSLTTDGPFQTSIRRRVRERRLCSMCRPACFSDLETRVLSAPCKPISVLTQPHQPRSCAVLACPTRAR